MFDGRFVGFADFLVLETARRYRLRDTKLARSVKVEALLQLAAYAETLAAAGVPVARRGRAGARRRHHGRATGSTSCCRSTGPGAPRCSDLLDDHLAGGNRGELGRRARARLLPLPGVRRRRSATHDDLLLVAGMRVSQRARLIDAGITTVHELAAHTGPVPDCRRRAVAALSAQARLQVARRVDGRPPYEVVDAAAADAAARRRQGRPVLRLRGRPAVDGRRPRVGPGVPVRRARRSTARSSRCGRTTARGAPGAAVDFLDDGAQAAQALPATCTSTTTPPTRRRALLRLAGRYGVGEDEVDDLLRNGVLVDLYPLVRKSIRVGTENYSLKSLEPLYMGDELRDRRRHHRRPTRSPHTPATASCAPTAATTRRRPCSRRSRTTTATTAARRDRLRDWLVARAIESGVPPVRPAAVVTADEAASATDDDLAPTRCAGSPATPSTPAPPNRPRSRWSRRPAGITDARTSRSGGRTSTG